MSKMIHTLCFNKPVKFKGQTGARFYNSTTKAFAVTTSCSSGVPAKLIAYEVGWTVPPQQGDRIEWLYDGSGTYEDTDHVRMKSQHIILINCCDVNAVKTKNSTAEAGQCTDCPAALLDQIRWAKNNHTT